MKHIKKFNEPVNEEIAGALIIGGILFAATGGAGALTSYVSSAWTKWMKERKYQETGKEEMVPTEKGDIKFIEVKDKDTGKSYWGVSVIDARTADPGHENEQFFIFDEVGFANLKKQWSKGKAYGRFPFTGSENAIDSWHKKPGNS